MRYRTGFWATTSTQSLIEGHSDEHFNLRWCGMKDNDRSNAPTLDFIRRLTESGFWGSITRKFEAGVVVHVRREENLKPSELSGNTGVVQCTQKLNRLIW
jgi:hypothetical protein